MYNPENNSGLTGGMAEEEMIGETSVDTNHPLYKEALKNNGYLNFNKAMMLAKESQAGDPSDPERGIANDIHAAVADSLGEEDYENLKFYSALGTPLDIFHGVDGFFEYDGATVTMDATINKNKDQESIKADVLLEEMPDPKFEREKYLEYIKNISQEISNQIKQRQAEAIQRKQAN